MVTADYDSGKLFRTRSLRTECASEGGEVESQSFRIRLLASRRRGHPARRRRSEVGKV